MNFKLPREVTAVMGHTRMTTQGTENKNFNNHPFYGRTKDNVFALAHNGVLFLDEIHRYSKTQQDALLPHLERGTFYLVGSTTENPSFQVAPALLSRVQVIMLDALDDDDIKAIVNKGFNYLEETHGRS